MTGTLRIARIFGISVEIHYTWLIVVGLLVWSLATGYFPRVGAGLRTGTTVVLAVAATLLFFAALLLHELAHSIVAIREGLPVRRITLFIFGGVAQMAREPKTAGVEFRMAIAGPLTSLLIAGVSWAISLMGGDAPFGLVFRYLAYVNTAVAVFNLVPAFPLDGGRVFRSAIWYFTGNLAGATRTASAAGQFFAYLLMTLGLVQIFAGRGAGGIWLLFIGWFLLQAAQAGYQQVLIRQALRGLQVRDVMRRDVRAVPAGLTLAQFVHDYLLSGPESEFCVMDDGRLQGVISLDDVKKVPRERWETAPVAEAMTPEAECPMITPSQSAFDAFLLLASVPVEQAAVRERGRLVGSLSRRDLLAHLRNRLALQG